MRLRLVCNDIHVMIIATVACIIPIQGPHLDHFAIHLASIMIHSTFFRHTRVVSEEDLLF